MSNTRTDPKTTLAAAGLTDTEMRCLAWIHFDGWTQQQIADELDMSRPWVTQQIKMGEAKLNHVGLSLREWQHGKTIVMGPRRMDRLGPKEIRQRF